MSKKRPAEIIPPFSNRNRGAHVQIDSDLPEGGRMALLHLLQDLVAKSYVSGWIPIAREVERVARVRPTIYYDGLAPSVSDARSTAEILLLEIPWEKVLDFCERLHAVLPYRNLIIADGGNVPDYITNELNRIFLEEGIAFEFRDGLVERRGRHHTSTQISRAQVVLGDNRLESARTHFNKGLRYFQSVEKPDYENAVKEAVCAIEATARVLFPDSGAKTLGQIIKSITGAEPGKLPASLANTFHGVYGFRSGGEGVAHGGATGGAASQALAEYVLAVAASQIILLVDLANSEADEVPI